MYGRFLVLLASSAAAGTGWYFGLHMLLLSHGPILPVMSVRWALHLSYGLWKTACPTCLSTVELNWMHTATQAHMREDNIEYCNASNKNRQPLACSPPIPFAGCCDVNHVWVETRWDHAISERGLCIELQGRQSRVGLIKLCCVRQLQTGV